MVLVSDTLLFEKQAAGDQKEKNSEGTAKSKVGKTAREDRSKIRAQEQSEPDPE